MSTENSNTKQPCTIDSVRNCLNTTVLPEYNCNNCKHFIREHKKIRDYGKVTEYDPYAKECNNVAHPLEDCVLRGFEAHSEQPGFSQTLNK
jgi:hypothetical protein